MYLSCNYGLKVANIPIVVNEIMEKNLMDRLSKVAPEKVYGLLMQPEILMRIREERGKYLLGETIPIMNMNNYFDLHEIQKELRFCRQLYVNHNWHIVDVTRRAIEEVSQEVLEKSGSIK
jgi:regulator of PEP synthase PpsR (kinase-PPPase family)